MKTSDTSQNTFIDKSIIMFFIVTIFITATVFAFKYANYTPCEIIDFDINAKNYRVGEIIRFKDNTDGAFKREWNFGDSSKVRSGLSPFHTYEKAGKYNIALKVNGNCERIKTIVIKEKVFILDSTKLAKFKIPSSIKVGEPLRIKDQTKDAYRWEWRFGETAEVNSTKKNPRYTYESPGLKTITLVVNDDTRYATRKKINVLPNKKKTTSPIRRRRIPRPTITTRPPIKVAPDEEDPKEFRAPNIKDSDFAIKIMAVADKKASAKDFGPYLCNNLQLPINARGKRTTFIDFCNKIKGKNIKIKELEIFRNKNNNCIEYITIQYSRTGLF
ncbi:PKD domain-containing protein [Aquimarina sp. I32.4]|uniref:PKD domain-containing protein n=1 Tax=Aquimarina sp. I32.4 TaxID=2053903 RepID=UPI000CDE9B62|nr:PKD domain-containing protein [Aquimarina sp. I32.4]